MNGRRTVAIAMVASAVAALTVLSWQSFAPLPEADACANAVREAKTRGAGEGRASLVANACGPLFREEACRDAHRKFDSDPPSERARNLARRCRDVYCPKLGEPKPALCSSALDNPTETAKEWGQLAVRVIELEHGRRAKVALDAFGASP